MFGIGLEATTRAISRYWGTRMIGLTCSRTLQTLLCKPPSRSNLSHIMNGVSGPLPASLPRTDIPNNDVPLLEASAPSMTIASRAFSRVRSRLSPSLSISPPEGRKAVRICRKILVSTGAFVSLREPVAAREKKGGSEARVAVVSSWFDERRHALSALIRPSES